MGKRMKIRPSGRGNLCAKRKKTTKIFGEYSVVIFLTILPKTY